MSQKAFQDIWPDDGFHGQCFGCGRKNEKGFQIKSYWEGDEAVCKWKPEKHHMAAPGVLCGGVIATLLDCHCLNTANALAYKEKGSKPMATYITGSMEVKLLRPTPMNRPIVLRAKVKELKGKKMVVTCSVFSGRNECARGEIIAIRLPEEYWIK